MKDISRREILKKTAAAAMVAAPGVLPVLGQNNRVARWLDCHRRTRPARDEADVPLEQGPG